MFNEENNESSLVTTNNQPEVVSQPENNIQPVKNSSKLPKNVLMMIIALIVAIILGASMVAADIWYQNPQKVLTDAVINVMTAKTSIYDLTADFSNTSDVSQNMSLSVKLKAQQAGVSGDLDGTLSVTVDDKEYNVSA